MTRATHQGHCQVCGRLHKVAIGTGLLAKHGYTVRFNFFEGVCWGHKHRPFEQATDAIELCIKWAEEQISSLRKSIAELNALPVGNTAPFRRYHSGKMLNGRWTAAGYREEIVTLEPVVGYPLAWTLVFADGVRERGQRYSMYGELSDLVLRLRTDRAARYLQDIKQRQEYISWQQARMADWKPQPLVPVGV